MFYSAPGRGEPGGERAGPCALTRSRAAAAAAAAHSWPAQPTADRPLLPPAPADDLGDLMQEMREGAAWVEGLAMDCELPSGSSPFGSSPSATPLPPPPPSRLGMCAADVPGSAAPPSADAGPSPFPLPEFAQKQPAEQQQHAAAAAAAQREAEEQEAPLQPSMAAKLMHPGAARGGRLGGAASGALPLTQSGHMIPVSLPGVGCEGESEPQPLPAMAGGAGLGAPPPRAPQQGSWLPPPLPYHCCPGASPSPQPPGAAAAATMQAAAFYGQQPPQQPQARPGASPSLAGFQTAPPAFFHQQQGMAHLVPQDAAGYDMAQLLSGVPQGASFQVGRGPGTGKTLQGAAAGTRFQRSLLHWAAAAGWQRHRRRKPACRSVADASLRPAHAAPCAAGPRNAHDCAAAQLLRRRLRRRL